MWYLIIKRKIKDISTILVQKCGCMVCFRPDPCYLLYAFWQDIGYMKLKMKKGQKQRIKDPAWNLLKHFFIKKKQNKKRVFRKSFWKAFKFMKMLRLNIQGVYFFSFVFFKIHRKIELWKGNMYRYLFIYICIWIDVILEDQDQENGEEASNWPKQSRTLPQSRIFTFKKSTISFSFFPIRIYVLGVIRKSNELDWLRVCVWRLNKDIERYR